MRHRNSVRQLGRTHSHRKAMFNNMLTSFLLNERIITTKQKCKELKKISEKAITRAKKNLNLAEGDSGKRLHNIREIMKMVKDRKAVNRLFNDIAPRFKDRKGGYTRIYLLGKRQGDAAEMAIIELVEKEVQVTDSKTDDKDKKSKDKKDKKAAKNKKKEKDKKDK